jgi:hypothetical protein
MKGSPVRIRASAFPVAGVLFRAGRFGLAGVEIDKEATPALLMFNLFSGTLGRALLEGWYER